MVLARPQDVGSSNQRMSRRRACFAGLTGVIATMGFVKTDVLVAASEPLTVTPTAPEGPHWIDGMSDRFEIRGCSNGKNVQAGFPLKLSLMIVSLNGKILKPISRARVDLWHCNAFGNYSGIKNPGGDDAQTQDFLRGYQVTTSHGNVNFLTIVPGWHTGRAPHLHVRVRLDTSNVMVNNFTTQLFFPEKFMGLIYANSPYSTRSGQATTNETDPVLSVALPDVGSAALPDRQTQLLLTVAKMPSHAVGRFIIVV